MWSSGSESFSTVGFHTPSHLGNTDTHRRHSLDCLRRTLQLTMFCHAGIFLTTDLELNGQHHYLDNHHHPPPVPPPSLTECPPCSRHHLLQSSQNPVKHALSPQFYRWGNKRPRRIKQFAQDHTAIWQVGSAMWKLYLYSALSTLLAPTHLLGKWASFVPALTPGKWPLRKWGERKGGQWCCGREMGFRFKSRHKFASWDTDSFLTATAHTWVCEYWYKQTPCDEWLKS